MPRPPLAAGDGNASRRIVTGQPLHHNDPGSPYPSNSYFRLNIRFITRRGLTPSRPSRRAAVKRSHYDEVLVLAAAMRSIASMPDVKDQSPPVTPAQGRWARTAILTGVGRGGARRGACRRRLPVREAVRSAAIRRAEQRDQRRRRVTSAPVPGTGRAVGGDGGAGFPVRPGVSSGGHGVSRWCRRS